MYTRILNLSSTLKRKSVFVFGPRQTGKSTFLKSTYPNAFFINLLNAADYRELLNYPEKLKERILLFIKENKNEQQLVIIDEIQKIPDLLDVVHDLIESHKNLRFILTGSSPRKLKRVGANMLGGRASLVHFYPITTFELSTDLKNKRTWKDFLSIGSLPSILNSTNPLDDLEDYITTYLKEEIEEEGLSRSLGGFSRFLNFSALRISEQLNFTSLASDAQLSPIVVKEYFNILNDTLIGYLVEAFGHTKKRKPMMTSKFYYFDLGIANALIKRKSVSEHSTEWGILFENFIHNEILAYLSYSSSDKVIQFWRSTSKLEVDLIVWDNHNLKDLVAIEIKSTNNPVKKHCTGLVAFSDDFPKAKKIIVCQCHTPLQLADDITAYPVAIFLEKLWDGKIV